MDPYGRMDYDWYILIYHVWIWIHMVVWTMTDWLMVSTPLKKIVSWDYYSQYMESHKIHVPNHQPVNVGTLLDYTHTHRIHGAAIYGNMDPINIPPMLEYIPAPWILWDMISPFFRNGRGTESHAAPPAGAWRIHPRHHQGEAHGTFHADGARTVAWPGAWIYRKYTSIYRKYIGNIWSIYSIGIINYDLSTIWTILYYE